MTDGLPERLDPDNNEFGYYRSMSIFREIAPNSAARISNCWLRLESGRMGEYRKMISVLQSTNFGVRRRTRVNLQTLDRTKKLLHRGSDE